MIDSINARISFLQKMENFDDKTNLNINKSFKNESKKSIKIEDLDNNFKNNQINDQIEVDKKSSLSKEPNNQLNQEIEKNNQINNEIKNNNQLNEENEEEYEFEEENNDN